MFAGTFEEFVGTAMFLLGVAVAVGPLLLMALFVMRFMK